MIDQSFAIRVGTACIPKANSFEDLCRQLKSQQSLRLPTVLSTVHYLTTCDFDHQPTVINISQQEIDSAGITIRDFCSTIKTIERLNQVRFGQPKSIFLAYRTPQKINYQRVKELEKSGLGGITASSTIHGIDGVVDSVHNINRGYFCPDFLVDSEMPRHICLDTVTPRQQQVLDLIVHRGLSNKQIARHLKISESAIKLHVGILLRKFGLRNRTELALAHNSYTEVQPRP